MTWLWMKPCRMLKGAALKLLREEEEVGAASGSEPRRPVADTDAANLAL